MYLMIKLRKPKIAIVGSVLAASTTLFISSNSNAYQDSSSSKVVFDRRVDALEKAIAAVDEHRLDSSDRRIFVSESKGLIVVYFFNNSSERRSQPRVVYDPRAKKIIFIAGDG